MDILPQDALSLLAAFAPEFTAPTYRRFIVLVFAAILTTGRHTVANLMRTVGALAKGHPSSFQRVLSHAQWSSLQLAAALARQIVRILPASATIVLVGDDTVDGHKGTHVHGKARHRDPVRSTHSYTAFRYGHKWVVLAILVRFPFATRPWALPVLIVLYRSKEDDERAGRRHRTPSQQMQRLLRLMLHWFPDRTFVFVGDAGYGTHEMARFALRHRDHLTLVSKLHPDAALYEPPPPYGGKGRPRIKGNRLPTPRKSAETATRRRTTVDWYGGGQRNVEIASDTGCWNKSGHGIVALLWVFVRDLDGTHRDEYFFTTGLAMTPEWVISLYTGRWNIETTFQEVRSCLGLETTRGWRRNTVLRAAPCLFGLYSVVALLYRSLPSRHHVTKIQWPGKQGITYSDAITSVRQWLWSDWVFQQADRRGAIQKLPLPIRHILFSALAVAA